jgi:hypothetical protein
MAWHYVGEYLDAARLQVRRIESGRRAVDRAMDRARRDAEQRHPPSMSKTRRFRPNIRADGHFYFICWHAVCRLLQHIESVCQLRRLKRFMQMKKTVVNRHIEIRDHLEHWIERLPGGRASHVLRLTAGVAAEPRLPGGYYFGLGSRSWDMSRKSLAQLTSLVDGFLAELLEAAKAGESLGGSAPKVRAGRRT